MFFETTCTLRIQELYCAVTFTMIRHAKCLIVETNEPPIDLHRTYVVTYNITTVLILS